MLRPICAGPVNTGKSSLFSWGEATALSWSKAGRHSPLEIGKLCAARARFGAIGLRGAPACPIPQPSAAGQNPECPGGPECAEGTRTAGSAPRGPQHLEPSATTSQRRGGPGCEDLRELPDTVVLKARMAFQVLLSSQPTGTRSAHLTFDIE